MYYTTMHSKTCSECGKPFYVERPGLYTYRVNLKGEDSWQCDFNCHNHALLRSGKSIRYMSLDSFLKYVGESESVMKHKGKQILHPILEECEERKVGKKS